MAISRLANAFLTGHRRRSLLGDRPNEGHQFRAQRLGMADREMAHRIAAVRLKPEAFRHLARQQVAADVFVRAWRR